jgi:hypothetical protein
MIDLHSATSVATVADSPADDPEPAEREQRAREALVGIHARLASLSERATQRQQELAALDARVAEAQTRAGHAAAALGTFPPAIARAKARVLVASSQPARSSLRRDVERLVAQQREAVKDHAQAVAEATRLATEAHVERERLAADADQEQAECAELVSIAPALADDIAALHTASGEALRARLEAEHAALEAARTAAQAQLDQATTALECHAGHVREALADHQAILVRLEGGPLLPRPPARVERALEAHLHTLAILAEGPVEVEMVAGVPLTFVLSLPGGPGLGFALQGRAAGVWTDAIKRAQTWLGSFRDLSRAQR